MGVCSMYLVVPSDATSRWTFSKAGKVGVWTKADSVTQFDDLTVVTK
jgi:hypothetical protein